MNNFLKKLANYDGTFFISKAFDLNINKSNNQIKVAALLGDAWKKMVDNARVGGVVPAGSSRTALYNLRKAQLDGQEKLKQNPALYNQLLLEAKRYLETTKIPEQKSVETAPKTLGKDKPNPEPQYTGRPGMGDLHRAEQAYQSWEPPVEAGPNDAVSRLPSILERARKEKPGLYERAMGMINEKGGLDAVMKSTGADREEANNAAQRLEGML